MIPRGGGLDVAGSPKKSCVSVAISRVGLASQASRISLTEQNVDIVKEKQETERARFLDGAFFEAFSAVDEKQKGSIKKAKQETKKHIENLIEKDKTDGFTTIYNLFPRDSLTKTQEKLMYTEVLNTITNRRGKRNFSADEISDGDLIVYAQQSFGIDREQHKKIYRDLRDRQPLKTLLNVTVVEGKGLEAKDANGLSDPFCMLAVINGSEGDKLSKDGKRTKKIVLRDIRDEDAVKLTKIKMNTLNPLWNERFELEVKDIENQRLRIDVWDKDDSSVFLDEDNRITSIKGFGGFNRFLKEVAQSTKCDLKSMDDFLGIVEVHLKDIPAAGLDDDFDLEPRTHKSKVQGSLHLKLRLSASQEGKEAISDQSLATPMKFQRHLLKQFLKHEYDVYFNSEEKKTPSWNMELSDAASHILSQFISQNLLTRYQEAVVKWEVYSRCIQDITVPMEPIIKLIEFIKVNTKREDLDAEEEKFFMESVDKFIAYAMELIRRHRLVFPPIGAEYCMRLGQLLLCLLNLYKLPLFKLNYPDRRLSRDLEMELKEGTKEWFKLAMAYSQPLELSDQSMLSSMVQLTNSFIVSLNSAKKKYDRLFKPAGIEYYSLIYTELEEHLTAAVQPALKEFTENMKFGLEYQDYGTVMFELYLALKKFKEKKQFIPPEMVTAGPIDTFHDWFKNSTTKWLDLAKLKAIQRIRKAVELDEVRVVDSHLKYSASAVDVTCCLGQICSFWNKLEWPDASGSYVFIAQIADIISWCASQYADIVLEKLKKVGYYEAGADKFGVGEKLCITMNNLEHVLHFLDSIPETLNFEDLLIDLQREHGEERVQNLSSTLENVMRCAQDDMSLKYDQIIVRTGEKLKEEVTKYLHAICKKADIEEDPYELADDVLSYIDHNLVTLNESLLLPAFKRCLIHVWEVFLFSMEDVVRDTDQRDPKVFKSLREVLHVAKEFFHGDGSGVDESLINLHSFENIDRLLSMYESSSTEVIEKYFTEKCEEQARSDEVFGALTFKAFYSQENKALHVDVLSVRDLPPLDSNGLADPYVELELLPKHVFKGKNERKTGVQHQTLFAIFDENFSFEVSTSMCLHPGATLVMNVMDRDRFHENDIAGEVFFDLNNLMGLDKNIAGGFSAIPQTELPLIHGSLIGQPFRVLMERKDTIASHFVKHRREKFRKMEECWFKAKERKLQNQR